MPCLKICQMKKIALFLAVLPLSIASLIGQNAYQSGWKALHEARTSDALEHFKMALGEPSTAEKAHLCLALLYSELDQADLAAGHFQQAFQQSPDLYPELYAMWFSLGAAGPYGKKSPAHLAFLQTLDKDPRNKGKLDAATTYQLLVHYLLSFDKKTALTYFSKLNTLDDWQLLGPFDNVMNSGYGKDFGALANPQPNATFTSRFGAKVGWFDPSGSSNDGYILKDMYFLSSNSIVYAQTFVESPAEQEVLLKFGYSGSLRVWLNDSLLYDNPEHRSTEMDYYRFRCILNKGYNRLLVQLGDFEESHANFTMRFTDTQHNPLAFNVKTSYQPYQKGLKLAEPLPYFALQALETKAGEQTDPGDLLYPLLLSMVYSRSGEFDKAEEILEKLYSQQPNNYFVLRELIGLYDSSGDDTNQNKYYALFEESYPEDRDILQNLIDEYASKDNIPKMKETIALYLSKYPSAFDELRYEILIEGKDGQRQKQASLIDKLYAAFPDNYDAMAAKYNQEKNYYNNPKKANAILEKYLKTIYNYSVISELSANYSKGGDMEKAIALLKKDTDLIPYNIESHRKVLNILGRANRLPEAIGLAKTLLLERPSDFDLMHDLALLHKFTDDVETSLKYYRLALEFFPFAFETNEEVRELQGLKRALELVPEEDPLAIIRDYETGYVPPRKHTYDIVYDCANMVVYNTRSHARIRRYIIKLNDENAIERWQHLSFGGGPLTTLYIDEVQTIKKNGQKIDADRNGGEVVFTNLEVGDYVYVSIIEKQVRGGKSSYFLSDKVYLNSHFPFYKMEYNLLVEDGMPVEYKVVNGDLAPDTTQLEGFTLYKWSRLKPELVKEEPNTIPFDDVANVLYVSFGYSWREVVDWYSDLSTYQAAPDFTIKNLVAGLFNGKELTEEEKARAIYDFVCKNIQYSSVDFRQSGHIPQKASRVYNSRLGDCKDVSTLYVSMARAAGLKANLVLISTADNGRNTMQLPSLDFNHCIVKVHLPQGEKFLELTDPDLPYGQLYHFHQGAPILEIPTRDVPADISLERLGINPGHPGETRRSTKVEVAEDGRMTVERRTLKTGLPGVSMVKSNYYSDEKMRFDDVAGALASDHKSPVSLKTLEFEQLEPRRDSVSYRYTYTVENDVMKLGSLRTLKAPFSDRLINMEIFKDENRVNEFDFLYYEDADLYEEEIEVRLAGAYTFRETPENMTATFRKSSYSLEFSKIDDKTMKIRRRYVVDRSNIKPGEFKAFKDFMVKVNEGENTHLVFQ